MVRYTARGSLSNVLYSVLAGFNSLRRNDKTPLVIDGLFPTASDASLIMLVEYLVLGVLEQQLDLVVDCGKAWKVSSIHCISFFMFLGVRSL